MCHGFSVWIASSLLDGTFSVWIASSLLNGTQNVESEKLPFKGYMVY